MISPLALQIGKQAMGALIEEKHRIEFRLIVRREGSGLVEILLYLYRDGLLAHKRVIAATTDLKARMILMMSRLQPFRQGYREYIPMLPKADLFNFGTILQRSMDAPILR